MWVVPWRIDFSKVRRRAGVNVLGRERGLGLGGFADRLGEIAALRRATIEDAGFVEVQMGLDEPGGDQPTIEVDRLALGLQARRDRRDLPRGDPDIAALVVNSRILQDEIQGHASPP